ncbi:MAG: hypothetical protein GY798_24590 [Hyphomicrobiales bacterium]|nr:hypothetical protein [Hyphomicrobiales bacterium]
MNHSRLGRGAWFAAYTVLAFALGAYYAVFDYGVQYRQGSGWIPMAEVSDWYLIAAFWALQIPALVVANAAAFRTDGAHWLERSDIGYALAAFILGTLFAGIVAVSIVPLEVGLTYAKATVFAVCHGLAAVAAALAVRVASRCGRGGAQDQSAQPAD